jgi:hypothetical protein
MDIEKIKNEFKEHYIILSVLSYGIGFIYNYFYYLFFKIPIIYFISITDFLLDAVTRLIWVLLMYIILLISAGVVFDPLYNFALKVFKLEPSSRNRELIFLWIAAASLYSSILFYFSKKEINSTLVEFMIIFLFMIIVLLIDSEKTLQGKIKTSKNVYFMAIIFAMALFAVIGMKFETVKNEHKYVEVSVDGKIIDKTSQSKVYVGETSEYIFFYDKESGVSTANKKDKLDVISYR